MKQILDEAKKKGYGVTAPNIYNEDTVRASIEAAEELRAPQILDFAWALMPVDMPSIAKISIEFAREASVPIALNLDHGADMEQAAVAIHAGLTSIMVDRSTLPFEENIAEVAEIVKFAHACGVSVEAELGHVGQGGEYADKSDHGLTDPAQAKEYVERTGIDCLAVAIGTAHGEYSGTPKIHFDRLEAITKSVDIPLVLHGGSGTGDENLAKACRMGISKVNLFTDLSNAGVAKLRAHGLESKLLISELTDIVKQGYKEKLMFYMKLFGQCDRV
jgi:fructose-bisphosphate aldolase class II